MKWISVEDQLPEVSHDYEYSDIVMVCDDSQIGLARRFDYNKEGSWSECYYIGTDVNYNRITHWMPLPEPPEEE